jgi:hypothetical protein
MKSTTKSLMPSSRVLSTDTSPSFSPGDQPPAERVYRLIPGNDAELEVRRTGAGSKTSE